MTHLDIPRQRLLNQRLVGTPLEKPDEVVRWLGAVQAQDYGGAKWALAQRTGGATNAEIDQLFAEGVILRTHVLRPTWHFVTPADIRWMLELTAPRVHAANAYMYRKLKLDDTLFRRSNELIAAALQGGVQRTRTELARVLEEGGIPAASGMRLGYIMMRAELDAVVCSGALRGKQFTYALLEDRVPRADRRGRDEALAELTRRYFTSHGPATAQDYAWWSGLSVAEARAGIEMAGADLVQEAVDDTTYWFAAPEPTGAGTAKEPILHLLPNYDEHLVAYKDHRASFDPEVFQNLDPYSGALMGNIVVLKGQVIGGWRRTLTKKEAVLTTSLLVPINTEERAALHAAAERYGRFLDVSVSLT